MKSQKLQAINMYNSIKNNEYGVAFAENQNLIIGASSYDFAKGKGINKIFYGTPGCGKSYHIQHNIHNTAEHKNEHGALCISVCAKDTGTEIIEQRSRNSQKIDLHVKAG